VNSHIHLNVKNVFIIHHLKNWECLDNHTESEKPDLYGTSYMQVHLLCG